MVLLGPFVGFGLAHNDRDHSLFKTHLKREREARVRWQSWSTWKLERVTYCKSAEEMLWGLSDGLMIILRHHLNNVETESDSKVAKYKRHPPPN